MYDKVSTDLSFVDREKEVVEFWKKNNIFEKSMENRKDGENYTFFDGPLSGLTLGTGGRYTGSSYGDPANSFKVGSYTVVDALVRYDLARVGMAGSNVALHVNNLFDREYVASCFNTYGCFWGAERQVVATATFRF